MKREGALREGDGAGEGDGLTDLAEGAAIVDLDRDGMLTAGAGLGADREALDPAIGCGEVMVRGTVRLGVNALGVEVLGVVRVGVTVRGV